MSRRPWSNPIALALIALAPIAAAAVAQSALAPFAIGETAAHNYLLTELPHGGRLSSASPFVAAVRKGYERIAPAARGPATTALFAWAKAYVSSAAFQTAYTNVRAAQKPQGRQYAQTADQELKKQIDDQLAGLDQMKQSVAALPAADRAAVLASIKNSETMLRDPEMVKQMRARIEEGRAATGSGDASAMSQWESTYPADPQRFVAQRLDDFLTKTARVDFTLPMTVIKGENGETQGFLTPGYTGMPWETIEALLAGKDAVTAGRAAAAAWLKELGGT